MAQPAASAVSTVSKIKAEGVIRVGLRHSSPPFSYFDERGNPRGFTWALCNEIVKSIEAELGRPITTKIVSVDLKSSYDLLAQGVIDIQCGVTTHTTEREKLVGFTNTFFVAGIGIAHRKGDARFAEGANYGRVLTFESSTASGIVRKRFAGATGKATFLGQTDVKTYEEGINRLKRKEADTFFVDRVLLPLDEDIVFRERPVEPYALMTRRNDGEFIALVDKSMARILGTRGEALANENGLRGRIGALTRDAWRRPSNVAAMPLY
jgi:glutamate/aspartate transport system substrate-binding protein